MKKALPDAVTEYIHKVLTLYRELPKRPGESASTIKSRPPNSNYAAFLWN
jgi:hypothetical protein